VAAKYKSRQQAATERAAEKKAVKRYMADWDPLNLYWSKWFLEHRRDYHEDSIQLVYAHRVAARLGFVFEEDVDA
jgi:hypothetical protein